MDERRKGLLADYLTNARSGLLGAPSRAVGGLLGAAYNYSPHTRNAADSLGKMAAALLEYASPAGDMTGMRDTSRDTMAALRSGDLFGAASNAGMTAAAIPMMFMPGTVKGVGDAVDAVTDAARAKRKLGIGDDDWLTGLFAGSPYKPQITTSQNLSERHGPSLSKYLKADGKTVRLSDHSYPSGANVDLRYGMDRDYAAYLVAKEFGLPITDDMARAAQPHLDQAAEFARITARDAAEIDARRAWDERLVAAGFVDERGNPVSGKQRKRAIAKLQGAPDE